MSSTVLDVPTLETLIAASGAAPCHALLRPRARQPMDYAVRPAEVRVSREDHRYDRLRTVTSCSVSTAPNPMTP